MELEMNGKKYPLKFGFDFLDYVNKHNSLSVEVEGQQMNTGMGGAALLADTLSSKLPSTLRLLIKGGTATLRQKPSNEDIEDFINEVSEDDDRYNQIFDDIETELGKQPAVSREMGLTNAKK